ncbi:membrane-associated protein, putative, partial [Bodo saltans]
MAQRCVLLVLAFILCHVTFGVKLPKFFYVAKSGATLEQCRRSCDATSGGAYPATILSAADNAAIGALFPSNSAYRGVIGGTRLVGNNNSFRWVAGPLQSESNGLGRMFFNGTTLGNGYCVSGTYCHFSSGEPNADPTHPDGPEAQLEFTSAD